MYQVIVADDEQIIREGLCKAIPWAALGMQLTGQAANGAEAWALISQHQPHIVITDIRMPHMDGIELVHKLRRASIQARVLILSGYGEFEYAQTAVKLGVSDYLMKPIDIDEVCKALRRVKAQLDEQFHHLAQVNEMKHQLQTDGKIALHRRILRFLRRRISAEQFAETLPETINPDAFYACMLWKLDGYDSIIGSMYEEEIFHLTQKLEEILLKQAADEAVEVIEDDNGVYILLFHGPAQEEVSFTMRSYVRRLRMSMSEYDYTTAVSAPRKGIEQCPEAYEMAVKTLERAFLLGKNQDVEPEKEQDSYANLPDTFDVRRIVSIIATFDKQAIKKELEQVEQDIRQTHQNSFLYTRMMVSFVYGEIMRLLADIHCPIQEVRADSTDVYRKILACQTLDGMMQELYSFIADICDFLDAERSTSKQVIEKAKMYMQMHFASPTLTLDKVAKEVGMSSNYFSALFKQNVGKSFIATLTEIRLEHAKKLLKAGELRSYEVSYLCGYENPTYFSTIFKRHFGISPTDYRAKHEKIGK